MKSTALAALAVVLAVTRTASAQTPAPTAPPATNAKITVRGCVSPAQRDGSLEARSAPTAAPTPEKAPYEANSGEFVSSAFLLTDATLVTGAKPTGTAGNGTDTYLSKPSSFTLQGL